MHVLTLLVAPLLAQASLLLPPQAPRLASDPAFLLVGPTHTLSLRVDGVQPGDRLVLRVVRIADATGPGLSNVALRAGARRISLPVDASTTRQAQGRFLSWPVVHRVPLERDGVVMVSAAETVAIAFDMEPGGPGAVRTARELPRLTAEVRGLLAAPVAGLQPLVPGGGARIGLSPRSGTFSSAALVCSVDAAASSALDAGARWDASTSLLLLSARGSRSLAGAPVQVHLGLAAGVGGRLAWHAVRMGSSSAQRFAPGIAARVEPEAGVQVGPGTVVLSLPITAVVDVDPAVHGFEPLAAALGVGYRLGL